MVYFIYTNSKTIKQFSFNVSGATTVSINKTITMTDTAYAERVTPGLTKDVYMIIFRGLIPKSIQTNIGTLNTRYIAQNNSGDTIGIISTGSTTLRTITIQSLTFPGRVNGTCYYTIGIALEIPAPITAGTIIKSDDFIRLEPFFDNNQLHAPAKFGQGTKGVGTTIDYNDGVQLASNVSNVSLYDTPPRSNPAIQQNTVISKDLYNSIIHAIDKDHPRDSTKRYTIGVDWQGSPRYQIVKVIESTVN